MLDELAGIQLSWKYTMQRSVKFDQYFTQIIQQLVKYNLAGQREIVTGGELKLTN